MSFCLKCSKTASMQRVCCNIVEVGAIFSIQLSSQSHFSKTKIGEVKAENKCEKHKKIELISTLHISKILFSFMISIFHILDQTSFHVYLLINHRVF